MFLLLTERRGREGRREEKEKGGKRREEEGKRQDRISQGRSENRQEPFSVLPRPTSIDTYLVSFTYSSLSLHFLFTLSSLVLHLSFTFYSILAITTNGFNI